jgi:hypothetical protein
MNCDSCKKTMSYSKYCGVYVCDNCNNHKDLARCYCGWSLSGKDGRIELEEMGEQIEEI